MNRFHFAALAAALTLAMLPSISTADPGRVPLTARVTVRDLDLATLVGQKQFRQRVAHAAVVTCGTAFDIHDRLDVLRCHREMRNDAQVRLAALTRARAIELASNTRR
ncbi:UrcA family protein [Sphingomonas sp. LR60]|uniref:UrcA family protein n=1 Tax=Sphingomonas sp. LR60 TaxID=3050233 RepID=UPI002FE05096